MDLLAVAEAACTFADDQRRGKDALLFCDSQVVCTVIAKDAGKQLDLQLFSTALHTLCPHWHTALWVEYFPTKASPAEELSRAGSSPYVETPNRLMMPAWAVASRSEPLSGLHADSVFPLVPTR